MHLACYCIQRHFWMISPAAAVIPLEQQKSWRPVDASFFFASRTIGVKSGAKSVDRLPCVRCDMRSAMFVSLTRCGKDLIPLSLGAIVGSRDPSSAARIVEFGVLDSLVRTCLDGTLIPRDNQSGRSTGSVDSLYRPAVISVNIISNNSAPDHSS
ncbi:hypothetical protein ElyMa_002691900 [Elysia marginata]|uniref:Uncharacterized protein n=1 Tax=Elysia marginata TaxID=1093978 RepID=A0AAV4HEW8_9GAST|nr:hypothetical protein ElyMa_002691900 [Elysia marginata]